MCSSDLPEGGCDLGLEVVIIEITNLGDTIFSGATVGFLTNTMTTPVIETITDTIPEGAV